MKRRAANRNLLADGTSWQPDPDDGHRHSEEADS